MIRRTLAPALWAVFVALVIIASGFASDLMHPSEAHAAARGVHYTIRSITHEYGYSRANENAMLWISDRESEDNPRCVYRGHYGLFQMTFGIVGARWRNPGWNTRRALKYIGKRYGSPLKAKRFWLRNGWY
jgi:hypothetical protein